MQWERESGATFETDKTEFIHFTKEPGVRTTIKIKDDIKEAADEVKVLGLVLDHALTYDKHIAQVLKRGLRAALAVGRLRGLSPRAARQLFNACVTPVVDYASPVWYLMAGNNLIRKPNVI